MDHKGTDSRESIEDSHNVDGPPIKRIKVDDFNDFNPKTELDIDTESSISSSYDYKSDNNDSNSVFRSDLAVKVERDNDFNHLIENVKIELVETEIAVAKDLLSTNDSNEDLEESKEVLQQFIDEEGNLWDTDDKEFKDDCTKGTEEDEQSKVNAPEELWSLFEEIHRDQLSDFASSYQDQLEELFNRNGRINELYKRNFEQCESISSSSSCNQSDSGEKILENYYFERSKELENKMKRRMRVLRTRVPKTGVRKKRVSRTRVPKTKISTARIPRTGFRQIRVSNDTKIKGDPKKVVRKMRNPKIKVPRGMQRCLNCTYETDSDKKLNNHQKVHEIFNKYHLYKCPKCKCKTLHESRMKKHFEEMHPECGPFQPFMTIQSRVEFRVETTEVQTSPITTPAAMWDKFEELHMNLLKDITSSHCDNLQEKGEKRVSESTATRISRTGNENMSVSKREGPETSFSEMEAPRTDDLGIRIPEMTGLDIPETELSEMMAPTEGVRETGTVVPKMELPRTEVTGSGVAETRLTEMTVPRIRRSERRAARTRALAMGVTEPSVPRTESTGSGISETILPKMGVPRPTRSKKRTSRTRVRATEVPRTRVPRTENAETAEVPETSVPRIGPSKMSIPRTTRSKKRVLKNKMQCGFCTYETYEKKEFKYHQGMHSVFSAHNLYKCPECTYKALFCSNIMKHFEETHSEFDEVKKSESEVCSSDDLNIQSTEATSNRENIYASIINSKIYNCKLCLFDTFHKQEIIEHLKRHAVLSFVELDHNYALDIFDSYLEIISSKHAVDPEIDCLSCNYTITKDFVISWLKYGRSEFEKCPNCDSMFQIFEILQKYVESFYRERQKTLERIQALPEEKEQYNTANEDTHLETREELVESEAPTEEDEEALVEGTHSGDTCSETQQKFTNAELRQDQMLPKINASKLDEHGQSVNGQALMERNHREETILETKRKEANAEHYLNQALAEACESLRLLWEEELTETHCDDTHFKPHDKSMNTEASMGRSRMEKTSLDTLQNEAKAELRENHSHPETSSRFRSLPEAAQLEDTHSKTHQESMDCKALMRGNSGEESSLVAPSEELSADLRDFMEQTHGEVLSTEIQSKEANVELRQNQSLLIDGDSGGETNLEDSQTDQTHSEPRNELAHLEASQKKAIDETFQKQESKELNKELSEKKSEWKNLETGQQETGSAAGVNKIQKGGTSEDSQESKSVSTTREFFKLKAFSKEWFEEVEQLKAFDKGNQSQIFQEWSNRKSKGNLMTSGASFVDINMKLKHLGTNQKKVVPYPIHKAKYPPKIKYKLKGKSRALIEGEQTFPKLVNFEASMRNGNGREMKLETRPGETYIKYIQRNSYVGTSQETANFKPVPKQGELETLYENSYMQTQRELIRNEGKLKTFKKGRNRQTRAKTQPELLRWDALVSGKNADTNQEPPTLEAMNQELVLLCDLDNFMCSACDFASDQLALLVEHQKTMHSKKTSSDDVVKQFVCVDCGHKDNVMNIFNNRSIYHWKEALGCSNCDYKTVCTSLYMKHRKEKHVIFGFNRGTTGKLHSINFRGKHSNTRRIPTRNGSTTPRKSVGISENSFYVRSVKERTDSQTLVGGSNQENSVLPENTIISYTNPRSKASSSTPVFQCEICDRQESDKDTLYQHIIKQHFESASCGSEVEMSNRNTSSYDTGDKTGTNISKDPGKDPQASQQNNTEICDKKNIVQIRNDPVKPNNKMCVILGDVRICGPTQSDDPLPPVAYSSVDGFFSFICTKCNFRSIYSNSLGLHMKTMHPEGTMDVQPSNDNSEMEKSSTHIAYTHSSQSSIIYPKKLQKTERSSKVVSSEVNKIKKNRRSYEKKDRAKRFYQVYKCSKCSFESKDHKIISDHFKEKHHQVAGFKFTKIRHNESPSILPENDFSGSGSYSSLTLPSSRTNLNDHKIGDNNCNENGFSAHDDNLNSFDKCQSQDDSKRENNETLSCEICSFKTISRNYLHQHRMTKHLNHYDCYVKLVRIDFKRNELISACDRLKNTNDKKSFSCNMQIQTNENSSQFSNKAFLEYAIDDATVSSGEPNANEHKIFSCNLCDFTTYRKCSLSYHKNFRHPETDPNYAQLSYKRPLEGTIGDATNKRTYNCCFCEYSASRKSKLSLHINLSHPANNKQETSTESNINGSRTFRCDFCDFTTLRKSAFTLHMKSKHPECHNYEFKQYNEDIPYQTDTNSDWSDSEDSLESTIDDAAVSGGPMAEGNKIFSCDLSEYTTTRKCTVSFHKKYRHPQNDKEKAGHSVEDVENTADDATNNRTYNCSICEYSASRKSKLSVHIKLRHPANNKQETSTESNINGSRAFSCDFCDFTTLRKSAFTFHMRLKHPECHNYEFKQHTEDIPYQTDTNSDWSDSEDSLESTIGDSAVSREPMAEGNKVFSCDLCEYTATRKCTVTFHKKYRHPQNDKEKAGQSVEDVEDTADDATNNRTYNCSICEYSASRKSKLSVHIKLSHPADNKQETSTESNINGSRAFSCEFCDFTTARKSAFTFHMKLKHPECHNYKFKQYTEDIPYQTDTNSDWSDSEDSLESTIGDSAVSREPMAEGNKVFSCDLCEYTATRKCTVTFHKKYRHPQNDKEKAGQSVEDVEDTADDATNNRTYNCSICEYSASRKSKLSVHIKLSHPADNKQETSTESYINGSRAFSCDFCDFTTARKSAFTFHMKLKHPECHNYEFKQYTEDIPYQTDTNSDWSDSEDSLESTIGDSAVSGEPMAEGNKIFSCDLCEYTATRKCTVSFHKKYRHPQNDKEKAGHSVEDVENTADDATNNRTYNCSICEYSASRKSKLSLHMEWRHPENNQQEISTEYNINDSRTFSCDVCDFTTARKSAFTFHMKSKHTKCNNYQSKQYIEGFTIQTGKNSAQSISEDFLESTIDGVAVSGQSMAEDNKIFSCNLCEYTATRKCTLTLHMHMWHPQIDKEKAEQCVRDISVRTDQNCAQLGYGGTQEATTDDETNERTSNCSIKSTHAEDKKEIPLPQPNINDSRTFCCDDCDFTTLAKSEFTFHMKSKHPECNNHESNQYIEDIPNQIDKNSDRHGSEGFLESTIDDATVSVEPKAKQVKIFSCNLCNYTATRKCAFTYHINHRHSQSQN